VALEAKPSQTYFSWPCKHPIGMQHIMLNLDEDLGNAVTTIGNAMVLDLHHTDNTRKYPAVCFTVHLPVFVSCTFKYFKALYMQITALGLTECHTMTGLADTS